MDKATNVLAALIVAGGLGLMVTQGALAQPKEGCEDATPGETAVGAQASEEVAEYVTPPGCDTGHLTDETAVGCDVMAEGGSNSPVTGREDCNNMEDLPTPSTEG